MLTPVHEPTTKATTRSAVEPAEETLAENQCRPEPSFVTCVQQPTVATQPCSLVRGLRCGCPG